MSKFKTNLSVIVAVYNAAEWIEASLLSIEDALAGIDAEIIVIDDGSDDSSPDIIRRMAENNNIYSYFHQENRGAGNARNKGIKMASGKYITFFDADDIVYKQTYHKFLDAAERFDADIVTADVSRLDGNKILPSYIHLLAFYNVKGIVTDLKTDPQLVCDTTSANKLFRSDLLKNNQIFFEEGIFFEDNIFTLKAYWLSRKTVVLKDVAYLWRIRSGNNKSITQIRNQKSLEDKITALEHVIDYAKTEIKEPEVLHKLYYKILLLDFDAYLERLHLLPQNENENVIRRINIFINKSIDLSVIKDLPVWHQQKILYLRECNIENLIRLVNYKKINYSRVPVMEKHGTYYMKVTDQLFRKNIYPVNNEFNDLPPISHTDSVEIIGNTVRLHAHVYIPRIHISDLGIQTESAYLFNNRTGLKVDLTSESELRPSLTYAKGKIMNYDDYMEYSYNYDGTGFCTDLDLTRLKVSDDMLGNNLIMIYFKNPVTAGTRVLRGIGQNSRKLLESFSYTDGKHLFRFIVDDRQSIILDISSKNTM